MKVNDCPKCNPTKVDWEEGNFYGYQCFECTTGKTAFIVHKEHVSYITPDEEKEMLSLIEKYYPDLKAKGLYKTRKNYVHFYEFLVRREA